jgi:hypothetical protein
MEVLGMLDLLIPSRRKKRLVRPRRARLGVEALETRDCPAAPAITSFSAAVLDHCRVQLTGTVADENPATATVHFSGAVSDTATPDANGHFSVVVDAAYLGAIDAVAEDDEGMP